MASDRTEWHVVPSHGSWQITRDGQLASVFERKADAVNRAVAEARQAQPSQVIVHTADGGIEDERTYQTDSHPPPG
jgi:hypothetical protein